MSTTRLRLGKVHPPRLSLGGWCLDAWGWGTLGSDALVKGVAVRSCLWRQTEIKLFKMSCICNSLKCNCARLYKKAGFYLLSPTDFSDLSFIEEFR